MKATLIFTSTLALASSAFGARINRIQRSPAPAGAPALAADSYVLVFNSDLQGTQNPYSDANGQISVSLANGDALRWVQINENPQNTAACFVRDAWGNQMRAFGGPYQPVQYIEFSENDARNAKSIQCNLVASG